MIPQATDGALRQGRAREGKRPEPPRSARAKRVGSGVLELRATSGRRKKNGCTIKGLRRSERYNIDI